MVLRQYQVVALSLLSNDIFAKPLSYNTPHIFARIRHTDLNDLNLNQVRTLN
jgi:hypothetical protein